MIAKLLGGLTAEGVWGKAGRLTRVEARLRFFCSLTAEAGAPARSVRSAFPNGRGYASSLRENRKVNTLRVLCSKPPISS